MVYFCRLTSCFSNLNLKRFVAFLSIGILILLISSCGPDEELIQQLVSTSVYSTVENIPTQTAYPTLTSFPTYTPLSTNTPVNTFTPLPTYTVLPTQTAFPTYTAQPTYTFYPTQTAYPTYTVSPSLTSTLTSTNEPIEIPFVPTASTPDPENLIRNGYFLEKYEYWERSLIDEGGSSKASIVESNNSPFNTALQISQTGLGSIQFTQMIPISSTDLIFGTTFEPQVEGGWGRGTYTSIILEYLDQAEKKLGMTTINRVYMADQFEQRHFDLDDTNTAHHFILERDRLYKDFTIDIDAEINENLLGINASDVHYLRVYLIAGSDMENESSVLTISDLVLK